MSLHRATDGRFSRNCSWKTCLVRPAASHRPTNQSFDPKFWHMFFFFSFNKCPFFFFAKTTAVTIQSVVAISSRSVSRMRVYRGGREGRGVTGELFILKTTFSPPAFWGGTEHGWKIFPHLSRVATSLEELISGLHLSRNGPKLLYRSILSSLRTWERVFQNRKTFAKVLR